jgi:hypothetical protein
VVCADQIEPDHPVKLVDEERLVNPDVLAELTQLPDGSQLPPLDAVVAVA